MILGKNNYELVLSLKISKKELFSLNPTNVYILFKINNTLYKASMEHTYFWSYFDKMRNEVEEEEMERQKQWEMEYKNSSEYRLQQRKNVINNLSKNIYDIKKDDFDNRIHITSKRLSSKFNNNSINILKANNLFIVPRCEVNSENYSPSFGMTITQMSSENKGINYLKGISFSNGENNGYG